MKAAIYEGIEKFRVGAWEKPVCGDDNILVKVAYCAICGTDVRIYYHGHKKVVPPAVIGHEITGTVVGIGKNVKNAGVTIGDEVTTVTSIGCGRCKMCRDGNYNLCPDTKAIGYFYAGGFAEYVLIPAQAVEQKTIIRLPKGVSLLEGALIEPLSCAINGQRYLAIRPTDTVLIYGGGPIGLMHASLALAEGAERVIVSDPDFARLEKFGAQFDRVELWNPKESNVRERILKETGGFGPDVVITACPVKAVQMEALEILAPKGRISLFGGLPKDDSVIPVDANIIHYKELSVFGSFASNRADFVKAADLIARGKIDAKKFITSIVPLEKVDEGIGIIKRGEALKVVVKVAA